MNRKFLLLILIFFISFLLFVSFVIFQKPLARLTRAKEEFLPSAENSLIMAYPLKLKADGKSTSNVNVFIRSTSDVPIANAIVNLSSSIGQLTPNMISTDIEGKASFVLVSDQVGVASIEAKVNNQILDKKISVLFE